MAFQIGMLWRCDENIPFTSLPSSPASLLVLRVSHILRDVSMIRLFHPTTSYSINKYATALWSAWSKGKMYRFQVR